MPFSFFLFSFTGQYMTAQDTAYLQLREFLVYRSKHLIYLAGAYVRAKSYEIQITDIQMNSLL